VVSFSVALFSILFLFGSFNLALRFGELPPIINYFGFDEFSLVAQRIGDGGDASSQFFGVDADTPLMMWISL
jgi:hypothetical protein